MHTFTVDLIIHTKIEQNFFYKAAQKKPSLLKEREFLSSQSEVELAGLKEVVEGRNLSWGEGQVIEREGGMVEGGREGFKWGEGRIRVEWEEGGREREKGEREGFEWGERRSYRVGKGGEGKIQVGGHEEGQVGEVEGCEEEKGWREWQ